LAFPNRIWAASARVWAFWKDLHQTWPVTFSTGVGETTRRSRWAGSVLADWLRTETFNAGTFEVTLTS
jgi:hypothetical protein